MLVNNPKGSGEAKLSANTLLLVDTSMFLVQTYSDQKQNPTRHRCVTSRNMARSASLIWLVVREVQTPWTLIARRGEPVQNGLFVLS